MDINVHKSEPNVHVKEYIIRMGPIQASEVLAMLRYARKCFAGDPTYIRNTSIFELMDKLEKATSKDSPAVK